MILEGKMRSEIRLERLAKEIASSDLHPRLATVIVGDDPASHMYVRMKHRACERVNIGSAGVELPGDAGTEEICREVHRLNNDPAIHGILVQLPLPPHVNTPEVIRSVIPDKDVDGFHPLNLGRLFSGNPFFAPCTPLGIMNLLSDYGVEPEGLHAVIVGRSIEVGRPMAALLLNSDATVTICHSRTRNLKEETSRADILVAAVGKARFIGPEMIREGAVVIDVGTNVVDGALCGDVDFDRVREIAGAITPVPGGVGPMTIATLMENTFLSAQRLTCPGAE